MSRIRLSRLLPTFAWMGVALVLVSTGGVAAQQVGPAASAGRTGVRVSSAEPVELHVQGADIRQVLKLISTPIFMTRSVS